MNKISKTLVLMFDDNAIKRDRWESELSPDVEFLPFESFEEFDKHPQKQELVKFCSLILMDQEFGDCLATDRGYAEELRLSYGFKGILALCSVKEGEGIDEGDLAHFDLILKPNPKPWSQLKRKLALELPDKVKGQF